MGIKIVLADDDSLIRESFKKVAFATLPSGI